MVLDPDPEVVGYGTVSQPGLHKHGCWSHITLSIVCMHAHSRLLSYNQGACTCDSCTLSISII